MECESETSRNTRGPTPGGRNPLSRQDRVNMPQRLQRAWQCCNQGKLVRGPLTQKQLWGSCLKSERRIGPARTAAHEKARNSISEMSFHEGIFFFYFSGANVFLHCFGLLSTSIHLCAHSMEVRGHLSEVSSCLSLRECQGLTQVTGMVACMRTAPIDSYI